MHILFVGSDVPGALERYCVPPLQAMGHEVTYYDLYQEYLRYCRFRSVQLLCEIEQLLWKGRYNRGLVRRVQAVKPDVILVFKGVEVFPATLELIRQIKPRPFLLNWNPDNPFDSSPSNTGPDLLGSITLYDVYCIWDRDLFGPLKDRGATRVEYLPFGYDPLTHYPVVLTTEEAANYQSEVCFVGGYTSTRAEWLSHLTRFDLAIWGPNWHHLPRAHPLQAARRGDFIAGVEMAKAFGGAQIVMNFIRRQNGQAHNMRTFEAPASGALMLSTRTRDQTGWLPEDEAAIYFGSPEEMVGQVEHYLNHSERSKEIATTGYQCITEGRHTYADRMQTLIDIIHTL